MKKIRNWVILIIIVFIVATALFITGRQHSIYFENKSKDGYEVVKDIGYSLNGEKEKKVRANRRGMGVVKGRTHELVISYKNELGKKEEIKKSITLGATEDVIIYLPVLAGGGENWIEEFHAK